MAEESIIEPTKGWSFVDLRAILQYRDLLFTLVWREFISKYKQTILGPLWYLFQRLMTTVVFSVIFGKVAKISTDGLPGPLFYFSGLLLWGYFTQCLDATSYAFTANESLFQKVYFPRLILPLSGTLAKLIGFSIQCFLFFVFFIYFKFFTDSGNSFGLTYFILMFPLLVIQTALISLGTGLWISSLTARYRDLSHLFSLVTQLWMYATPVIYPLSTVPVKWHWLLSLNPMSAPIELCRLALLGTGTVDFVFYLTSIVVTLFILFSGLAVFGKIERTFMDTL